MVKFSGDLCIDEGDIIVIFVFVVDVFEVECLF